MESKTVSKNENVELKETVSSVDEETELPVVMSVTTLQEINTAFSEVPNKRDERRIIQILKDPNALKRLMLLSLTLLTIFGTALIFFVALLAHSTFHDHSFSDWTPFQSTALNLTPDATTTESTTVAGIPTTIRYQSLVKNVLPALNVWRLEEFVRVFSSFPIRHADSKNGAAASKWLQYRATDVVSRSNYNGNVLVKSVDLKYWLMDSVVARIEGSDPILKSEVVILCTHMDSLNKYSKEHNAPGADDNASGSAVVLEVLRVLRNFKPKRSIEFHWYSAEEVGLVGSAEIAEDYAIRNVKVVSVLNLDCVGYYVKDKNEIYLEGGYTSDVLNSFLELAVEEYCDVGHKKKYCGYKCSDHVSWNKHGVPAAFAYSFNRSPDTIKYLNFSQVMEFAKLATAYVIETAEPIDSGL